MWISTYLVLSLNFLALVALEDDLYKVLGVRKTATNRDIKQAYKKLAREWHPDKNPDPSANERFMKINEAYETLGDEESRKKYDKFGTSSADIGQNQQRGQHFRSFFGGGGFRFQFDDSGGNDELIEKYNINLGQYNDKILPGSREKPYLLYAYADFCFNCMRVEVIWDKIVSDLENIGVGIGTIHVQLQRGLMNKLRATSVPAIMVVIDGKVKHYNGPLAIPELRKFFRTLVPASLITQITDSNFQEFLDGWDDNHVRMIFCDTKEEPSLRYMMPAFTYRRYVTAGFINTRSAQTSEVRKKYGIQNTGEALLMFNENPHPSAQMSMQLLPRGTIDDVIETHKYLILPRLSSQEVFNNLCPAYSNIRKKSLCVVLITKAVPEHNIFRDSFRDYVGKHQREDQRVRYTYVNADTQKDFVSKLVQGEDITNTTAGYLKVALLWRKETNLIQFDWLEDGWHASRPEVSLSQGRLEEHVKELLSSKSVLPYFLNMFEELVDEHKGSLVYRMLQRLSDWYDQASEKFFSMDEITVVTVVSTVVCLLLVFCLFKTVVDEPRPQQKRGQRNGRDDWASDRLPQRPVKTQVDVFQMSAVTFDKFVVKSPKGVRTLVILVNQDAKTKLINQFSQMMVVHSRSKAFQFAFLQLEDDLTWFTDLLQEATGRDLSHINPHNCLGTVLAINGPRNYFSVYHAHKERNRARRQAGMRPAREQLSGGDFVGLRDSSSGGSGSSDSEEERGEGRDVLFEADLLAGLGMWMDKLCEGTTPRLRVDEWPQM